MRWVQWRKSISIEHVLPTEVIVFRCQMSGVAVLGFGVFLMVNFKLTALTPSLANFNLANMLLISGIIISCVSFLGFLGALKENRCLLLTVRHTYCTELYFFFFKWAFRFFFILRTEQQRIVLPNILSICTVYRTVVSASSLGYMSHCKLRSVDSTVMKPKQCAPIALQSCKPIENDSNAILTHDNQ